MGQMRPAEREHNLTNFHECRKALLEVVAGEEVAHALKQSLNHSQASRTLYL